MELCINDSGTWRNITTLCVNDSGTWRCVITGCINDSGTWRQFKGPISCEGGYLICQSGGVNWIVAPRTTEVSRNWFNRNDAVTLAEASAACGDWFIPTGDNTSTGQLYNPGYLCRECWDTYSLTCYWADTDYANNLAWVVNFTNGGQPGWFKPSTYCVRAFRCVTY